MNTSLSVPDPQSFSKDSVIGRLRNALRFSLLHLPRAIVKNPLVFGFLLVYSGLRLGLNLFVHHASLITAMRSLVFSLLFPGISILLMDFIQHFRQGRIGNESLQGTQWGQRHSGWVLVLLLAVWLFWLAGIIDGMQRREVMPGSPILDILPGWGQVNLFIGGAAEKFAQITGLEARTWHTLISNTIFRILLPLGLLAGLGYRWRDFGLSFRNWKTASPLLAIFLLLFMLNRPDGRMITVLGISLIYPGLVEELFYRGLLQRSLVRWLSAGTAALIAALFFGVLHIPFYFFEFYRGDLALTTLNIADVILMGLLWGYGFLRTGSVLPWAVIHALDDIVFWL